MARPTITAVPQPDPCPLARHPYWRALCDAITDQDIIDISSSDPFDFEIHQRALHAIKSPTIVDFTLDWNPREALALTRWDDLKDGDPDRNLQRWWSATALLIGFCWPGNDGSIEGAEENLAIVMTSHRLRPGADHRLLGDFLDHIERAIQGPCRDEMPFIHAAQGIVSTWQDPPDWDMAACAWHRSRVAIAARWKEDQWNDSWPGLLNSSVYNQRANYWSALLDECFVNCQRHVHPAALTELTYLKDGLLPC